MFLNSSIIISLTIYLSNLKDKYLVLASPCASAGKDTIGVQKPVYSVLSGKGCLITNIFHTASHIIFLKK